ncbi:IclR family transcriptional regulator [Pseudonocardia acidicola]|uniref:Helix-turn-helix domain-containing protein n=1 Tax=Pseudonocardia acidicola TaxID=2724939 RepID=A0ABX1SI91_9PSEU|nr:helix-turn-helix domain-containing protein [Pseudonocardia acidicola]NMI01302.1 helix-turn-helix domain-containing protein [Pseudonocardia acidicola]
MDRSGLHRPHHRTVDRVAEILETVTGEPDGITLSRLAVRMGAPVSSIQKLVNGLVATGYLAEVDLRYRLGPAVHVLSLRGGGPPAHHVRHADLEALHRAADAPVLLAIRVGHDAVYVDWAGTDEPFDYALARRLRSPLLGTAAGRVLMAHMPAAERREWVAAEFGADEEGAVETLELAARIRAEGMVRGRSGPLMPKVQAVAAPVREGDEVVAAVSIAHHRPETAGELDRYAELLRTTVEAWAARTRADR